MSAEPGGGLGAEPLAALRSIRTKLALLVGVSTIVAALVAATGAGAGVPPLVSVPVTIAAALAVAAWLARGMTAPLREMTEVTRQMATGDYTQRVEATATDEVGDLARAFNTMAADLRDVDRQRRELISTVSHELRTPLAAQRAVLENVVDGVVRPDDQVLRTALAQSERLSALVEDLLDLSRIDGGSRPLHLADVTVRDLLTRCVAESDVGGRAVRLQVEVAGDLRVRADEARLHQVVANLLDNATRHGPTGGTVRLAAGPQGADRWWLEVTDEGPGVPPEARHHLFERYGTAGEGGSGGGTGLGLAIASWVVELHGGTIRLLDAPTGARFRVDLPRRPVLPPADPPPQPTRSRRDTPMTTPTDAAAAAPTPTAPTAPTTATTATTARTPSTSTTPTIAALFGRFWPEEGLGTQLPAVLGSLGLGTAAALLLTTDDGIRSSGLAFALLLVASGVLVLSLSPGRRTPWTLASAVVCAGLAVLLVVRDASWWGVLGLATAGLLIATALTRAWTLPAMALSGLSWGLAALRGLPLLGRTITATTRQRLLWPVLRTVAVSVVALLVFGALFSSADALFGSWARAVLPDYDPSTLIARGFVGFLWAGMVLTAAYLSLNPPRLESVTPRPARSVTARWEWLVPLGVVVAMFAAFHVAQAQALWGGAAYLDDQTGLTHAEYVHQGFGQLTVASVLTLLVVWLTKRKAPATTAQDRRLLQVSLGVLCVLALAVVASALYRMHVYQEEYGFTVLRLVVDAFELWVGLVLVMVLVAGVRLRGRWVPRAALLSGALTVLGLGLMNPEAWVAQQNIDRYDATGRIDLYYLSGLGPDAIPTLVAGLPADLAQCAVDPSAVDAAEEDGLLGWNLGRARAAEVALEAGLGTVARSLDCGELRVRLDS